MKEKFLELLLKEYIKKSTGIESEVSLTIDDEVSDNMYIIKSFELTSQTPQYKGFQLSNLKLNTVDSSAEIKKDNNKLVVLKEVPMQFSVNITNDNLDFMTSSDEFQLYIYNLSAGFSNYIQLKDIAVKIVDNKIRLQIIGKLQVLFGMPVKITIYPELTAIDGKLHLKAIKSDKASAAYINKFLPSLKTPQPLSSYVKILKDIDNSYYIDNFSISDNEICITGMFILPANCDITE